MRGIDAEHADVALGSRPEAFEDLDGRRLPGAVRPEEGEDLAALDLEVDARDRFELAVSLVQPFDGDDRIRAHTVSIGARRAA